MREYPKPWWFRTLRRLVPERCREIPHARETDRVLLRQVAIVKNHVYLQQFASSEFSEAEGLHFHSHGWAGGTVAIGLWGRLGERRLIGVETEKVWRAPYLRYMGPNYCHMSYPLTPGHTSLFIGLGKKTDRKYYIAAPAVKHWREYIKKVVRRL